MVMPPFIFSPFIKWTFALCGGAAIAHWMVKEMRRINEELERIREPAAEAVARERLPTLRRDPRTGEWRLM
jgi:hypothetical protein